MSCGSPVFFVSSQILYNLRLNRSGLVALYFQEIHSLNRVMKTELSCRCLFLLLLFSPLIPMSSANDEIGFIETFALAEDREEALKSLIPGTKDYYYYHALHALNQGKIDEADGILETWVKRHGETNRVWEIRNRRALLHYSKNPRQSLDYISDRLNLRFNHRQQKLNEKPDLPTALKPDQVSQEAFRKDAFRRSNTLSQVSDAGLDHIIREGIELNDRRRRDLLNRLVYPDYDRLVGLIAADLRTKESRGFGEFAIHRNLLPEQLDELLGLKPDLIKNTAFVHTKIRKLHPNADVNWQTNSEEREAYLTRVWNFTKDLDPVFNSLKAHSLYQLLDHYRRQGEYPRDLFLNYIALPRRLNYVEPEYLRETLRARHPVDLNADFQTVTACPPIRNDEPLVREYLLHFFIEEENIGAFDSMIRDTYLKPLLAEAKLTHGVGDAEKWYSLLSPSALQNLKDRVDIEFSTANPERWNPDDEVTLQVALKNVPDLIVKVYEINALNYFLDQKRDLNTDLKLDGLIANEEKSYRYDDTSIRRINRTFTFESLKGKRGTWVIELIGNGLSSRALIRKGRLQYLSRPTPAGLLTTVLDENNQKAESPAIWFGGKRYVPSEDEEFILLPFSTQGNQPVILTDGDFASFESIDFPGENYQLDAGFHVDREALLPGKEAKIAVRPSLHVNGEPTSVTLLENVKLRISTTDMEGISSVNEVPGFQLFDDRESLHTFRVPTQLRAITVVLEAETKAISRNNETVSLTDSDSFELNGVNETALVRDFHLSQIGGDYVLEVLGKTGEAIPDLAVSLSFQHREFTNTLRANVKTDASGRIVLTSLPGITSVRASANNQFNKTWPLSGDNHSLPASIHATTGQTVRIPASRSQGQLKPSDFVILEKRGGTFVKNDFARAALKDGLIEIEKLTPGDYEVYLRNFSDKIELRITDATATADDYALSRDRHLQIINPRPLQISSIKEDGDTVSIQIGQPDPETRVHVVATRFLPDHDLFHALNNTASSEPVSITKGNSLSLYVSARDIGEEYRYILERRAAKKFPGNMLTRPAVILNPWSIQDTDTSIDQAEVGEDYKRGQEAKKSERSAPAPKPASQPANANESTFSSSLDFLANQSVVFYNLAPDENGVLSLNKKDLGDRQHIHVLAVNAENTAYRQVSLAEKDRVTRFRDLRLQKHLDREKHFTQQRNATVLKKGDTLRIEDFRSSELETYDTLASVYATISGMSQDPTLAEFRFILDWPELAEERKRELYSKYTCHELNFFISRRDPDFFRETVQPYLANKRDKTFFDDFLVESDLTEYTQPWRFGRLNIVERILLARRLGGDEPAATRRHVDDLFDLTTIDRHVQTRFFTSALRGLSSKGGFLGNLNAATTSKGLGFEADPFGGGGAADQAVGGKMVDRFASDSPAFVGRSLSKLGAPGAESPADPFAAPAMPASAPVPAAEALAAGAEITLIEEDARADSFGFADEMEPQTRGRMKLSSKAVQDLRQQAKQESLFRKLESTKEWAENNYYHRRISEQVASLVQVNEFWKDYAAWDGNGGFYSQHFPATSGTFAETMLALAVLDVPFKAEKHELKIEDNLLTLQAQSPAVIFHQEIKEAKVAEEKLPILVTQNFFRNDDRYIHERGERRDKFVTEEFLTGVLYGSQVVITNPTSTPYKLDLLLQIPQGAVPGQASDYTKTEPVTLPAYATHRLETYFYFPQSSGDETFGSYPVQVARDEELVAWTEPFDFKVVDQLSQVDKASWPYLSQFGTEKEVLDYLKENNVDRLELSQVAWRARENVDFFRSVIDLLDKRHTYDETLWSYGIFHNDTNTAREYLTHREDFLRRCGKWIDCELVTIDPVERHWYEHLEYSPLVNARAHQLGRDRKILNSRFHKQYRELMNVLSYRNELDEKDQLATAYYLFLQDRVEEGLDWLARIENPQNVETRLQLDYLDAYASLYREKPEIAARLSEKYADYPVDRWRHRFVQVAEQVKEIQGAEMKVIDEENREQNQENRSANAPFIDLTTEGRTVTLQHRNLANATVNYYEMDLEFLFSSQPFVSGDSSQFSFIKPNFSEQKALDANADVLEFEIPERFHSKNVLVEVVAGGKTSSAAVYANNLKLQLVENYGQLQVRNDEAGSPLSKVYVKVYARHKDGSVRFFKDGYTDLRGKFDYVSLNTNELDNVSDLSLLIMSEKEGSVVKEVKPPQR